MWMLPLDGRRALRKGRPICFNDRMQDDFLDFGQLRTFLRVVDEKGVVRAARSLNVSQPSVSQQIRRLEQKLDRRLFARRERTMALTSDGEALVIFARALFAVADKAQNYFMQPGITGSLRIGLNEDLARTALPSVLYLFSQTHPNFHLEIQCSTDSQSLFQQIDAGRLDLVVARCPPGRTRGEAVWTEQLHWMGHRQHRGPIERPVPLAVPPPPSETREVTIATLNGAGLSWRVRFESHSMTSLEAAIKAGLGVCAAIGSMQSEEVGPLGEEAGLPELPSVVFFMDRRAVTGGDPGIEAFAALLRKTVPFLAKPPAAAIEGRARCRNGDA